MDSGIVLSSKSVSEDENIAEITPDGRYVRYKEVLGRGAFKVVYRGFDQEYGMEIAWNQISIDDIALQSPEHQKSLLAEADLVKSLGHENVIKCYCSWVDTDSQTINMITELFSSGCLRQYRRKHKSVDIKAIKNWARQILRGLLYLHCHNPVIIHRDLKCDNIFVNGNLGEVKIGDLGFAAIMRQGTARSVVGTPEFMAPELYDEEYNELVDIYSFGMCMLELITCEYPYSECKNQAQVYKKVTSGIKPAAFSKVKDPEVRRFIEKCLVSASERLSAAELLKDPFLSSDSSEKLVDKTVLVPATVLVQKITDFPKPDSQVSMDIVSDCGKLSAGTFVKSMSGATSSSTLELQKSTDDNAFRLQGKKAGDGSIEFSLCFNNLECTKENYEFLFDPAIDCALSIACELVEQHVLAIKNVPLVAELMDSLLLRFVPGWRASCGNYILKKNSCEDSEVILESPKIENHGAEESVLSDLYLSAKSNSTCTLDARPADNISDCESIMMSGCTNLSGFSYVDLSSAKSCDLSVDAVLMVEKGHDKDWFQGFMQDPNGIRMQCELGCCELLRAWENALESAKKKWISNLKLPVV